jgi:hypothetical protein
LIYATYYGGDRGESPRDLVFDAGRLVVCGVTSSSDLRMTRNTHDATYWSNGAVSLPPDIFCAILDPRRRGHAQLRYSTYLGGHDDDRPTCIARLPGGRFAIGGTTQSYTFPTTPNALRARAWRWGDREGFLAILDPEQERNAQLIYSTHLGGVHDDEIFDVAFDGAEGLVLAGYTSSADFPTTPDAYQRALSAPGPYSLGDAFVTHLLPFASSEESQLAFSSFHGGADGSESFRAIAMASPQTAVAGGGTNAEVFPTTANAYQRTRLTSHTEPDGVLVAIDLLPLGVAVRGAAQTSCAPTPNLLARGTTRIGSSLRLWSTGMEPLSSGVFLLDPRGLGAPTTWLGLELLVDPLRSGVFPAAADAEGRSLLSVSIPASGWLVGRTMGVQCIWADHSGTRCPPPALSATPALAITFSP